MITATEIEKGQVYREMGMTDDEYALVKNILGRLPNYTELGLFSVMWSEHCSYKNSKKILRKFPTEGSHVLQGPGEGAGIVDIGDGLAVVFKIESHNHPSAIEPYQGAATGVGGIVRDVFSMGARPLALLNSLRFGELDNARTRYLFEEVVAGIAGYGNCVGIPTIGGEIQFDGCYAGNPLVNVMCLGLLKHGEIKKGVARGVGNSVMYVGAPTGRDGIHGATFASTELGEEPEKKRPAVQVGDAFMEKLLIESCLKAIKNPGVVGIQDMGAAGLISSSCEMASKGGTGIIMNLDNVPQRETNMNAYEMMLSESQERMLLVVKKGCEKEIEEIFKEYELHAVTVGQVTDTGRMQIYHKGELMADVPADALAKKAPEYDKPSKEPAFFNDNKTKRTEISVASHQETLLKLLQTPTIAEKHWVYQQFDHMVRTNTVVPPGKGAGVIRIKGTNKALAMTIDCNGRYVQLDPFVGGQIAVAEAARNVVASGAKPLAVTDNLNFGAPENPEIFWQIEKSADGIAEACRFFGTPVIGGNVSLYNERGSVAIYPTPTVGMVGLIEDLCHITTPSFKNEGDVVFFLGTPTNTFGGSELQKLVHKEIFGPVPEIDLGLEKRNQDLLLKAIKKGLVCSAIDISKGGFAVALVKCVGETGAKIELEVEPEKNLTAFLFAESQSCFIFSVKPENADAFGKLTGAKSVGVVTKKKRLVLCDGAKKIIDISVKDLHVPWKGAIECQLTAAV